MESNSHLKASINYRAYQKKGKWEDLRQSKIQEPTYRLQHFTKQAILRARFWPHLNLFRQRQNRMKSGVSGKEIRVA